MKERRNKRNKEIKKREEKIRGIRWMKMKCQRGMVTREKERDSGYLDNICCIHGLKRIEGS